MNVRKNFESNISLMDFVNENHITVFTSYFDPCTRTYVLNYLAPEEAPEETPEEAPSDTRSFIVGALVGYLEDKENKAMELESIAAEVANYYDSIEWVEIY